jgi:hypothetical protein
VIALLQRLFNKTKSATNLKANITQFQPKSQTQNHKPMKKFYAIIFALITAVAISSCTEQEVKPKGGGSSGDNCQFGGPGCPGK